MSRGTVAAGGNALSGPPITPAAAQSPGAGRGSAYSHRFPVGEAADDGTALEKYATPFGLKSHIGLAATYIVADVRNRPRNFSIGVGSLVVVVFVVALILIAISKGPVIFVRFAEQTVGEMDSIMLAEGALPFINYTELEPKIMNSSRTSGSVPRWLLKGEIADITAGETADVPDPDGFVAGTTPTPAPPTPAPTEGNGTTRVVRRVATSILIVDSSREKAVGVGRAWPYRQIGWAETQVLASTLSFLDVRPNIGQRAKLLVDVGGTLAQQGVLDNFLPGQQQPTIPVNATADALPPTALDNVTALQDTVEAATVPVPGLGPIPVSLLLSAAGVNLTNLTNTTLEGIASAATAANQVNNLLAGTATPNELVSTLLQPEMKLTVADAVEGPDGKYPASIGNVVVLDYHTLVPVLIEQLCYETVRQPLAPVLGPNGPTVQQLPPASDLVRQANLTEYVLFVVAMMADRLNIYYQNTKDRDASMILWTNDLFLAIGIDFAGSVQYPIALALVGFDQFALFLNSLFQATTAVIIMLGVLLIYTLMLTNSEERSFEVAMLRAQGMSKSQLFTLLVMQTLSFVIPGLLLAAALMIAINAVLEQLISGFTKAPPDHFRLDTGSAIFPLVVGVVIPVVANFGPIRAALRSSLRDALDVYRNVGTETTVTVQKLAELGLEPWQLLMGWFFVIAGFLIYYMIPLSFLLNELWLFFAILNVIMLGMLFGLCLVSHALQPALERGILWLLLWGKEVRLKPLVLKNFEAHRERNNKGFIMFTMSIAAVIFGGVLFELLANSITSTVKVVSGADVMSQSLSFDQPLNKTALDLFLRGDGAAYVAAWSFVTFALNEYPQTGFRSRLGNVIGFPSVGQGVVGIDERFLDAVFPEYVLSETVDEDVTFEPSATGVRDYVRSLYDTAAFASVQSAGKFYTGFPPTATEPNISVKNSIVMPAIIAASATPVLGVKGGSFCRYDFNYYLGQRPNRRLQNSVYLLQARALMKKLSGFPAIGSLRFTLFFSQAFVSVPDFLTLVNSNAVDFPANADQRSFQFPNDAVTTARYQKVFIRLQPGLTAREREFFVNYLQSQLNPYYTITQDTEAIIAGVELTSDVIIYFFFFASAIAIVLDTLMLWLTFVANVQLNAWGFAVLRSLGFTTAQLTRAFVYEALCIVIGSFVTGTIIGIIIALTLVAQLNLFLQLPFQFDFPVALFVFLMVCSLVSAVLASYLPANAIGKKPISSVLKHGA